MIEELFKYFVEWREHTAEYQRLKIERPYIKTGKLNKKKTQVLEEMAAWCAGEGLDPRWWLYSLFACRKWIASPRWDQLVPRTNKTKIKAINRYHTLRGAPLLTDAISRKIRTNQTTFDPNRDMSGTAEGIKRRYLLHGQAQRCMDEMQGRTLGYHPKSFSCARCPVRAECEKRLQTSVSFDIVALRRGDITVEQAKRAALDVPR